VLDSGSRRQASWGAVALLGRTLPARHVGHWMAPTAKKRTTEDSGNLEKVGKGANAVGAKPHVKHRLWPKDPPIGQDGITRTEQISKNRNRYEANRLVVRLVVVNA
jgi:hypothetical protein